MRVLKRSILLISFPSALVAQLVNEYPSDPQGPLVTVDADLRIGDTNTPQNLLVYGDIETTGNLLVFQDTSVTPTAGMIRWTGSDFEGYDGSAWVSLSAGAGSDVNGSSNTTTQWLDSAWGYGNTVDASHGTAWGFSNTVEGDISTAWGISNTVGAIYSTAWGRDNTLSSANPLDSAEVVAFTTSWGQGNAISSSYGTAWGVGNTLTHRHATAWGASNQALGQYATAWGYSNESIASYATTWGVNNEASGVQSTAFGRDNFASGARSTAIGYKVRSGSTNSMAVGFNNIGLAESAILWNLNDPVLEVGIGTSDPNRKNALTVLKDGRVIVGSHSAYPLLTVETLQSQGAILINDYAVGVNPDTEAAPGAIRFDGTDFWGYDGTEWKSLTSGSSVGTADAASKLVAPSDSSDVVVVSNAGEEVTVSANLVVNGSIVVTNPAVGDIPMFWAAIVPKPTIATISPISTRNLMKRKTFFACLLTALTLFATQVFAALEDGLIGHWPLDGDQLDYSNEENHGFILPLALFVPNPTGEGKVLQTTRSIENLGHFYVSYLIRFFLTRAKSAFRPPAHFG